MPFRTLDHLPMDRAALTAFFRHVRAMMRPGGRFAFNIANPQITQLRRIDGVPLHLGRHECSWGSVELMMVSNHDWDRQRYRCDITAVAKTGRRSRMTTWSVDLGWVHEPHRG
jgi:hypothetical protein